MQTDRSHDDTLNDNTLSTAMQRRLELLQDVLPAISTMVNKAYDTARKRTPTRLFWNSINIPLFLLEEVDWKLCLNRKHDSLLDGLLKALENLVVGDEGAIAKEYRHSKFPRLYTIGKEIRHDTLTEDNSSDLLLGWAVTKPDSQQECSHLKQSLDQLADLRNFEGEHPLPEGDEDAPTVSRRSKISYAPIIRKLFSILARYCRCRCIDSHTAVLLLSTRQIFSNHDDAHFFSMLFSRGRLNNNIRWRELGVSFSEQSAPPAVRIRLPDELKVPKPKVQNKVMNLCKTLEECNFKTTSKLSLEIAGTSIFCLAEKPANTVRLQEIHPVSLKRGYLENPTELSSKSRTCLALVLSYALLDFCWEPWFPDGWTKSGISLLQDHEHVRLQPALVTRMDNHKKGQPPQLVSDDLKLLFHAMLLMEVFEQREIAPDKRPEEVLNISKYRDHIRFMFEKVDWGVYEFFRRAVESCISGYGVPSKERDYDCGSAFVSHIHHTVIHPLEREYTALWAGKDPDEVLEEVRLPSVQPLALRKAPSMNSKTESSTTKVPGCTDTQYRLKLFDTEISPESGRAQAAEQWFQRYKAALDQQREQTTLQGNGVKIGILDTGIDTQNPSILSKLSKIGCWPNESACIDRDGHGTHVAYLIHQIAPRAKLLVAKVCESQFRGTSNVLKIAEAIRLFSSGPNRVDIINMSFGFPTYQERMKPILEAIREARAKGVLLFAAAGNEGGNGGVAWPARLNDVICVAAADSNGNPVGFNVTDERHHRICTLGKAVPSCEFVKSSNTQKVYRNGTSFATPIAVAIAAIVLGYIDKSKGIDPKLNPERLKQSLRTQPGMESVLCKTCVQKDGKRAGYSYIAPWFFFDIESSSRIHLIADVLKDCPE